MNKKNKKGENKKNYIENQINIVNSTNNNDVIIIIKRIENEFKLFDNNNSNPLSDIEEDIVILNNPFNISKQTMTDLNTTIARQNTEISIYD